MLEKTYRQTHMLTYFELCHSWIKKLLLLRWYIHWEGHPWWPSGKQSACNAGEVDLISGSGRSSGERNSNPLQYSCMGNPMDKGVWQTTVHGVAKNWTPLSDYHQHIQWEFYQRVDVLYSYILVIIFSYEEQFIILNSKVITGLHSGCYEIGTCSPALQ